MVIISQLITPQLPAQVKKIKKEIQKGFVIVNTKLVSDSSETVKLYNEKGNVTEETEKSIWPAYQRVVLYKKVNFYSTFNKPDSTLLFVDNKLSLKLVPIYDSQGKEVANQEYGADGKPGFKATNEYNPRGKKIKTTMYDPHGQVYNFKTYKYNKNGDVVDESGSEGGIKKYRWTYSYDVKRHLIERKEFDGEGKSLRKRKYEYDKPNLIVKETIFNPADQIEKVIKYTYEFY